MPVPESVRKVPRPKNTIVEDSGRDSDLRYSVRERAGSKYVSGHNPSPRNGKVIGHIINSEYVPIDKKAQGTRTGQAFIWSRGLCALGIFRFIFGSSDHIHS